LSGADQNLTSVMSAAEARVCCEKMIRIPRRERRRIFKQACPIFLLYGYHIQQNLSNPMKHGWYMICVSGGHRDMGRAEKMDCRANGEVIF
jgi:hypothetical protein